MFTHPGPYEEQEHVLPQDAQNQPPYLENSPEFYAGMVDQKYNQHYPKHPYANIRGKFAEYIIFCVFSSFRFTKLRWVVLKCFGIRRKKREQRYCTYYPCGMLISWIFFDFICISIHISSTMSVFFLSNNNKFNTNQHKTTK